MHLAVSGMLPLIRNGPTVRLPQLGSRHLVGAGLVVVNQFVWDKLDKLWLCYHIFTNAKYGMMLCSYKVAVRCDTFIGHRRFAQAQSRMHNTTYWWTGTNSPCWMKCILTWGNMSGSGSRRRQRQGSGLVHWTAFGRSKTCGVACPKSIRSHVYCKTKSAVLRKMLKNVGGFICDAAAPNLTSDIATDCTTQESAVTLTLPCWQRVSP